MSNQVTVGICAYNEGKNLGNLLHNVLHEQDLPEGSEVLLVCSGCTDNTAETALTYASNDSRVKIYFEEQRRGKASAINHILTNAKGNLIFFISADTLPKKGIFSRIITRLKAPEVGIVCGNPVPVNSSHSLVDRFVQVLWSFHAHVFKELNDAGLARHATELFCIRKGIVTQIPEGTVNDDAYIAVMAKKRGWLIKYETNSPVSICGPTTFGEYFQQRRRIIYGHLQIRKLTGESAQYLVHLLPLHPVRVAKLASWLFTKYDVFTLAAFGFTEFLANASAILDFACGKTYSVWAALPSTKSFSS